MQCNVKKIQLMRHYCPKTARAHYKVNKSETRVSLYMRKKEGSELFVYADDAKLFSHINSSKDVKTLQNDLNVMNNWIKEWSLNLNIGKCRIVSYGRKPNIVKYDYFIGNEIIERAESITDLIRSGF